MKTKPRKSNKRKISPQFESTNVRNNWWTNEENVLIRRHVFEIGPKKWPRIALHINTVIHENYAVRSARQCREHWNTTLNPSINTGAWSDDEDQTLLQLQSEKGRAWSQISKSMTGRTENSVKNRWNFLKRTATNEETKKKPSEDDEQSDQFEAEEQVDELIPQQRNTTEMMSPDLNSFDSDDFNVDDFLNFD